jgi:hypothetical protein
LRRSPSTTASWPRALGDGRSATYLNEEIGAQRRKPDLLIRRERVPSLQGNPRCIGLEARAVGQVEAGVWAEIDASAILRRPNVEFVRYILFMGASDAADGSRDRKFPFFVPFYLVRVLRGETHRFVVGDASAGTQHDRQLKIDEIELSSAQNQRGKATNETVTSSLCGGDARTGCWPGSRGGRR